MANTLPKALLIVFAIILGISLLSGISNRANSFEVTYDNDMLKIQNVSFKTVELRNVLINDRRDCKFVVLTPHSKFLKVGDSIVLLTQCDVVRVTITTADGSDTYNF